MNENLCKKIIANKNNFIPSLFTERQISLLQKYLKKKKLRKTEQTYFYSTIKKKIDAIQSLEEQFYMRGDTSTMISERVEQAKKILEDINKEKAFISGSFLFSKKYNDIDIFIVGRRRKQYHQGKRTYIGIRERDLQKPLFYSAAQYCVSNFDIPKIKPIVKRPTLDDIIFAYQVAINEILDNEDQKIIREILLDYYLFIKCRILDSYNLSQEMYQLINKEKKEKIKEINSVVKQLLLKLYSTKYLYNALTPFIRSLKKDVKQYKTHDNLLIYIDLFGEITNECRRTQTGIA